MNIGQSITFKELFKMQFLYAFLNLIKNKINAYFAFSLQ